MQLWIVRATLDFRDRIILERVDTAKSAQTVRKQRHLSASPVVFCLNPFILVFKRRSVGIAELVGDRQYQRAPNSSFVQKRNQITGRDRIQSLHQLRSFRTEKMLVMVH